MSKLMQELDEKLTAYERLEHAIKTCDFKIISCDCGDVIYSIHYDDSQRTSFFLIYRDNQTVIDAGFPTLARAITRFLELTEH